MRNIVSLATKKEMLFLFCRYTRLHFFKYDLDSKIYSLKQHIHSKSKAGFWGAKQTWQNPVKIYN